jgi:glycine oxidase
MRDYFDVIVAGGGVIGASIAWRLACRKVRVLVLGARKIGGEASSAAAGMLAPGGEFDQPLRLLDFAIQSLAVYEDFVGALEADSGITVDFRHCGTVQIALTDAEYKALSERAVFQRAAGIPALDLTRQRLHALAPLVRPDAVGAIHYTNEATVDPVKLMTALRAACLARGVTIQEDQRVTSIAANPTNVRVSVGDGSFGAAFAIVAAGAWSGDINVTFNGQQHTIPRSFPKKGHLLGYRLPAGSLATTIRHAHTYILQRASGFTIAGSSTEDVGYDRTIDPGIVSDLAARAAALVPSLASIKPESVWIGFRPAIHGAAPHIGRVESSRLWLAYGHYRNGILLAPATCDQLCPEIVAQTLSKPDLRSQLD